jgi:hypothetical protein
MPWGDIALLVASAFAIAVVFCGVFGAAAFVLWKMLAPREPRRGEDEADEPGPLMSFALPFTAGDAFDAVWIVWLFVIGLLVVWAVWSYIGPWVLRRAPRLSDVVSRLLPLPPNRTRVYGERPRWDDGSPRVKVTNGPTRLDLIKGIRPSEQPSETRGGKS